MKTSMVVMEHLRPLTDFHQAVFEDCCEDHVEKGKHSNFYVAFEIIKFNVIESSRFDYHKLRWVEEPGPAESPGPDQPSNAGDTLEVSAVDDKIEKSA